MTSPIANTNSDIEMKIAEIQDAQDQKQSERAEAKADTADKVGNNATAVCTVVGAVIGGIVGGVATSGAGAVEGAQMGAEIGKKVGGGVKAGCDVAESKNRQEAGDEPDETESKSGENAAGLINSLGALMGNSASSGTGEATVALAAN